MTIRPRWSYAWVFGYIVLVVAAGLLVSAPGPAREDGYGGTRLEDSSTTFADTLRRSLKDDVLVHWYPRVVDSTHGGYLSDFAADWTPGSPHNKFIVTQARHVWTTSRMHEEAPRDDSMYVRIARHGVDFLRSKQWDHERGGFHSLLTREGAVDAGSDSYTGIKTAYGHAFAIYGLARFHAATGEASALRLAQRTFRWLDDHAHDDTFGGYFRSLRPDGRPHVDGYEDTPPKGQNSTIHLLEAFTELYAVAPDTPRLRERLRELLRITRDTMVSDRGSLRLFYQRDWTPISYRDSSLSVRKEHVERDHLSFGHDVETAFLMLEAAEALGLDPVPTLETGKMMVDHAIEYGWDADRGGLYDAGLVIGPDSVLIAQPSKAWWAQAEALHTFLLMAHHFPEDPRQYGTKGRATWRYIDRYLIDEEHGGWYVHGLDTSPEARTAPKGSIWKGTYHNARALLEGAALLEHANL